MIVVVDFDDAVNYLVVKNTNYDVFYCNKPQ